MKWSIEPFYKQWIGTGWHTYLLLVRAEKKLQKFLDIKKKKLHQNNMTRTHFAAFYMY